jgi:hypothetical protein
VGETSLTFSIIKKLATPQRNLFLTDLELMIHGFVDQNNSSRGHNLDDYATGGSEQI